MFSVPVNFLNLEAVWRFAACPDTGIRTGISVDCISANDGFALQLGKRDDNHNHSSAHWAVGVKRFCYADKINVVCVKHLPQQAKIQHRAGNTVKTIAKHSLDFSGAHIVHELCKRRSLSVLTGITGITIDGCIWIGGTLAHLNL